MYRLKNPEVDLKLKYKRTLELAIIGSLVLHLGLFHALPNFELDYMPERSAEIEIEVKDIPQTEHVRNLPPPPARPSVPIPTEDPEVPEDLTIEQTDINLDLATLPPPPESGEGDDVNQGYVFIPYDEPPAPIGGYAAIQKNLKYPEIARKAGLEGSVVLGVLIDKKGNAIKTEVLKDSGTNVGFEEAASRAVMTIKWKPAKQRDTPVKVWVSVPIRFSLQDATPVS